MYLSFNLLKSSAIFQSSWMCTVLATFLHQYSLSRYFHEFSLIVWLPHSHGLILFIVGIYMLIQLFSLLFSAALLGHTNARRRPEKNKSVIHLGIYVPQAYAKTGRTAVPPANRSSAKPSQMPQTNLKTRHSQDYSKCTLWTFATRLYFYILVRLDYGGGCVASIYRLDIVNSRKVKVITTNKT